MKKPWLMGQQLRVDFKSHQVSISHIRIIISFLCGIMNLFPVLLVFLFLCTVSVTNISDNPTQLPSDISVNCGSIGTFTARNGREWIGDVTKHKPNSFLQVQGSSATSTANHHSLISADPVPHKTARVSRSQFSYAFQVSPGQKILRLHFHSAPHRGFKGLKDIFTVEAGPFILLSSFSASLTANALRVKSFSKEFYLVIQENQQFNLSFSPETSHSLDTTYAFINGIEIISVPASLSYFQGGEDVHGVKVVGQQSLVYVDHHTALELIQRLYIKHSSVQSSGDFDDAFSMWALQKADKVKNKDWKIEVDVGFRYMIRLHFSETGFKIYGTGDVAFQVLINGMIAQTNIDLVVKKRDDENKIPRYRDYIVMMRGGRKMGKRDLSISLHSCDELIDGHGLLAGFEIFKLANPDNILAGPNPFPLDHGSPSMSSSIFHHRYTIAFIAVTIISLVNILVHKLREYSETNCNEEENKPSARAERLCRRFTLTEIQLATRNFCDGLLIGRGGFGKVYKGLIDGGQTTVAVKRLKSNSSQGAHEFLMEIETLSELRHVNLVSLIGYCNERREMILVYDYMSGGTLSDQLYKLQRESINCHSLTWNQRLRICIGAGRGLDYLHTGRGVIHRDVKTSNILLDENFIAKVSDFGLAKHEDRINIQSHVSTRVKGTNGYLDPHYLHTRKLTRKTDTYAFGVVLFEILCGKRAVDLSAAEDDHILTIWARDKISKGEVDQIVDLCLREEISLASRNTFVGIAERCLREDPKNRPTMSQVVQQLELSVDQQDNKQGLNEIKSVSDDIRPSTSDERGSVSRGQSSVATSSVSNLRSPPQDQISSQVGNAAGTSSVRRATARKPLRHWPWEAFWNRVKPSKKKDLLSEIWEEEASIRLTKYDWDMIAAATNQFSHSSVIGRGVFGSVHKGVLTGQVIAVKRLSPSSEQGVKLREFINEIHFLPNLQHRNIIKLLGYCTHREEKLLVYEFMENASLDTFILVDEVQRRKLLKWELRFKIITGIARGVVYLQQDSGLRLIHRDVKLSNILLDNEMNPKISDFALARAVAEDYSDLESALAGTVGYIPPECMRYGTYSFKSDVYSFGISILEIISGMRAISWGRMNASYSGRTSLLNYAWDLWNERRACDLIDESLVGVFPEEEALRCIQVGLLCTQRDPNHRPEMASVVKMLEGDELLGEPGQPPSRLSFENEYSDGSSVHSDGYCSNATFELDEPLER